MRMRKAELAGLFNLTLSTFFFSFSILAFLLADEDILSARVYVVIQRMLYLQAIALSIYGILNSLVRLNIFELKRAGMRIIALCYIGLTAFALLMAFLVSREPSGEVHALAYLAVVSLIWVRFFADLSKDIKDAEKVSSIGYDKK